MANVFGTDNSETLNAFDGVTNGADTIFGFGGNDSIFGLGGNDEIKGGAGADAINGGSGTDTANYSDSGEGVVVSLVTGEGFGGTAEGDDLTSIENLTGSAHDDFLVGNDGNNVLVGLEDNDILKGGGGADTLYGDSGNDTLKGGGGADTLNGGSGIDTASYADSSAGVVVSLITDTAGNGDAEGDELNSIENVTGSAHDDTLFGNDGTNVLRGNDGDDTLKGFGGSDTIWGGEGNDHIDGGTGSDTLRGDEGNDTYVVDSATDVVVEVAGEGTDTVRTSVSYTLTANVENLSTTSATGTSAINLTGNGLSNVITGNDGNNVINGLGGADSMVGNGGNDSYNVDNAGDTVTEAAADGHDIVYSTVSYTLSANVEDLSLFGGAGISATGNNLNNALYGNGLANIMNGGTGADAMAGYGGNDSYNVDNAGDTVSEAAGEGHDIVYSTISYTLSANVEDLSLFGGAGVTATGNDLNNAINGNVLDNTIDGRDGADSLNGQGGNDTFVFRAGEAQGDTVYDFSGNGAGLGDTLRFEGYGTAAEGATFIQLNATDWQITSADGLTVETITLAGGPTVDATDYMFV